MLDSTSMHEEHREIPAPVLDVAIVKAPLSRPSEVESMKARLDQLIL